MEFYYRLSGKFNQAEKKHAMIDDNKWLLFCVFCCLKRNDVLFSLRNEFLSGKNVESMNNLLKN